MMPGTQIKGHVQGWIFNLQRFSLHDGPGIRTAVFFKGCPLRCPWCHNPEGMKSGPELWLDPKRCLACGACREACSGPFVPGDPACQACGQCAEACPAEARRILGEKIRVDQLLRELERDRSFFESSGGGITLSGGEPLAQASFCRELLRACQKSKLSTALETCGFAPEQAFLETALEADWILFDLKGFNEERHQAGPGVSQAPILRNLQSLVRVHPRVRIRLPIIPGWTDDWEEHARLAEYLAELGPFEAVELLPFHDWAQGKRARLGSPGIRMPQRIPDRLEAIAQIHRLKGLKVLFAGAAP